MDPDGDESIIAMVPLEAKVFFMFVLLLMVVILCFTATFNRPLFALLDCMADCFDDIKECFLKCRKAKGYDEYFQTTGKKKDKKRYQRMRYKKKDSEDNEGFEENDEDSDDEMMMSFWKMAEEEDQKAFEGSDIEPAPASLSPFSHALKMLLGLSYEHQVEVVSCQVVKVGGLLGGVLQQEPWKTAERLFVRLLLLTKDGIIINKNDSKSKKLNATVAGEICYDEYFNFKIPLCQINNVILLVSIFVVCSNEKKEDGDAKRRSESAEKNQITPSKTPVCWISFGLKPSSSRTLDQWSLMVQNPEQVRSWHEHLQSTTS